jgi:hypothetical protein
MCGGEVGFCNSNRNPEGDKTGLWRSVLLLTIGLTKISMGDRIPAPEVLRFRIC